MFRNSDTIVQLHFAHRFKSLSNSFSQMGASGQVWLQPVPRSLNVRGNDTSGAKRGRILTRERSLRMMILTTRPCVPLCQAQRLVYGLRSRSRRGQSGWLMNMIAKIFLSIFLMERMKGKRKIGTENIVEKYRQLYYKYVCFPL